jgi:hypothetical protein
MKSRTPADQSLAATLRLIFPADGKGYLNIWHKQQKKSTCYEWADLDQLEKWVKAAPPEGDYYFCSCLLGRPIPENERGRPANAQLLPALIFDLDVGTVGHAKTSTPGTGDRLPKDITEAKQFIRQLEHPPSLVVQTGGGLQLYYIFNQPLSLLTDEGQRYATELIGAFQDFIRKQGRQFNPKWDLDDTSELTHLYRLPGSLNSKHQPPARVTLDTDYCHGHPRYSARTLASWVGYDKEKDKPARRLQKEDPHLPDAEKIAEECPFMKHCRDEADTLPEPEWSTLMLPILHCCKDGDETAHQWSQPYSKYNSRETEQRLMDIDRKQIRPARCETIAQETGGQWCRECPHFGKIKTPVTLGLRSPFHNWVYVEKLMMFFDRSTLDSWSVPQFNYKMAKEAGRDATHYFLRQPWFEQFHSFTYRPGDPLELEEEGRPVINLWTPNPLLKDESLATQRNLEVEQILMEHICYLFPDEKRQQLLLRWLAWAILKPKEKIRYACVLIGIPGLGKGYWAKMMAVVQGSRNVRLVENDELHESYTTWAKACQLVIVDEVMAKGRMDFMNQLKAKITEDTIRIHEKFLIPYMIPNYINFLMFSNYDNALLLEEYDRRYMILKSEAQPQPPSYYERLFRVTAAETAECAGALRAFFRTIDISQFNPNAHAPMTQEKAQIQKDSVSKLEWKMREDFEQEQVPFRADIDIYSANDLAIYYRETQRLHQVDEREVIQVLKKLKARPIQQQIYTQNGKKRLWIMRRFEIWDGELKKGKEGTKAIAANYEKGVDVLAHQPGGHPYEGQEWGTSK